MQLISLRKKSDLKTLFSQSSRRVNRDLKDSKLKI